VGTTSASELPLLVVGGGVGGLAAALALARAGTPAHVIEAAQQFGEIGAGIQLAPNATRGLDELGVLDELREQAVHPQHLVYMDALSGKRITSVDLGAPFLERYGHPYVVIHRTDLHSALLEACRAHPDVKLETAKKVVGLEQTDAAVVARCADGSAYRAGALVGADGLHSVVRPHIHVDDPVASEYVAYRGAIPFSEVTPHAGVDSMVMWVGPDLHLVQYKLRGGELYNQVGVFRSRRYGQAEDWGSPDELDEHFGRCCPEVRHGASLLHRDASWRMYDRDPIGSWTRGRVTLLGDAAHPMLQYLAQGACQAIEDALALARHTTAAADVRDAFAGYEDERVPRTAQAQRTARRFGRVCHVHGAAIELRNELFGRKAPQDYEPFDWLYESRMTTATHQTTGS
jgi:salicylate hydroxylase